jgi:ABC-2 type transport system permease protein
MISALSMTKTTGFVSVNQLLPYYILISLIYPLTVSTIDEEIDELSATGDVNNFLLKPFSLFRWLFARNLSEKAIILITLTPLLLIVGVRYDFGLIKTVSLFISLLLSFVLSFTLSFFAGLFCFWVDEFWAVHNLKYVIVQLLGGVILPYSFFPGKIAAFLRYSPFPYLVNWQVRIIQGQTALSDYFTTLVWIMTFLILVFIIQRKAIRKYSFTGS